VAVERTPILSPILRTQPDAELLERAPAPCGHSFPGLWYPRPVDATGPDSRVGNVEGLT